MPAEVHIAENFSPISGALKQIPRVALVICFLLFAPGLTEQFEAPKAAALLVVGLASIGAALSSRDALRQVRWHLLDVSILAWLSVEILATGISVLPRLSLLGEPGQRDSLLTSVALVGIYLATRVSTRTPRDLEGTLLVALAAATVSSVYAIAQAAGLDPLAWTRTSGYGAVQMRPFGTLGHPNLLGAVASACLASAVPMALGFGGRRRALPALAALPLVAAILLSLSRSAWLGALSGVAVAALLARRAGASPIMTRKSLLIAGASTLAVGGGLWIGGWGPLLQQRFQQLLLGAGRTRIEIWRAALDAFAARPWLGHGPDTFGLVFPSFQTPEYWNHEWGGLPLHAHSIYLHALATRGLLGAAAGAVCIAGILLAAGAAWRAGGDLRRAVPSPAGAIVALGVAGGFGSIGVSGSLLLVIAAASLAALATSAAPATAQGSDHGPVRAAAPFIIGGALALAALSWAWIDLRASAEDRQGQDLVGAAGRLGGEARRLALERAERLYESAASRSPLDDGTARRRAIALLHLSTLSRQPPQLLDESEREARRSVSLAPLRAVNHQCLGAVLMARARMGDAERIAEGEAAYSRSLELAPLNGIAMMELARAEMDLGRSEAAFEAARSALRIYPGAGGLLYQSARALLARGERDRARETLERAVAGAWHGEESDRRDALRLLDALRADPTARSDPGRS